MAAPSPGPDVHAHLALQAILQLLQAQRRRVRAYTEQHRAAGPAPHRPVDPSSLTTGPTAPSGPSGPSGQQVLDALPVPALLVLPVLDGTGELQDAVYLTQNAAARAYAAERLPEGALPRWTGPVSLFERFSGTDATPIRAMLARAAREGVAQGPQAVEWVAHTPAGPVRINDEVRIAPCGEHLLLTWERGHRGQMAAAAQRLVRTCWAEWNLGDDGIDPSRGFRQVLGLSEHTPLPTLSDLAAAVTADSLPGLHQALYDVILRKRRAECALRLRSPRERVLRLTVEPVRVAPGSLVWAVRGVLTDVTAELRRRESARRAEREARRQRQRAETVAELADALRDVVLPHFQDGLAPYGLEAAAVYRPDAREAGVGGDWYKARPLPNGRLLLALGDARGHGLDAVTLMAKLRYALAGLAYTEAPVEQLTHWLNELACADGIESTATAVVARYHSERSLLRWTCAGHPRPVLVRDGRAAQLPFPPAGPGLPLGVLPGAQYTAAETTLRVGDIVLMYTDGLTERRGHDPDEDTRRFLDTVQQSLDEPSPGGVALHDYAQRIVGRLDGPHRTDDATLLALRRRELDQP